MAVIKKAPANFVRRGFSFLLPPNLFCFFEERQAITTFVNLVTCWNLSQRAIFNVFGEEVEGLTVAVTGCGLLLMEKVSLSF